MRTCNICYAAVMPAHLKDHARWHSPSRSADVESFYIPQPRIRPEDQQPTKHNDDW